MNQTANKIKVSNKSIFVEYELLCKDIEEFENKILDKRQKNKDRRKELQKEYHDVVSIFNQIISNSTAFYK